jgi:hypothetical protein
MEIEHELKVIDLVALVQYILSKPDLRNLVQDTLGFYLKSVTTKARF